jgi:type VI secretion system secreted protein Hcp
MALNPSLFLTINKNSVKGFNSQQTKTPDGSIEVLDFKVGASAPIDWSTGSTTGRREHQALSITKRTDATTPLIWNALTQNQVVAGTIKFYRPTLDGSSKDEQFYTVEFGNGRIASITQAVHGKEGTSTATTGLAAGERKAGGEAAVPYDVVTFAYTKLTLTYSSADAKGVQASDDWSNSLSS